MEHRFTKAKVMRDESGAWLCLLVDNQAKAGHEVFKMRDKLHVASIKEYRNKRSKNANDYCWALCTKLAEALNTDKDTTYQLMLERYGKQEIYTVPFGTGESLIKAAKYAVMEDQSNNHDVVRVFIGSSRYNSKEMYHFLQGIISECESMDIETATPDEVKRMARSWGE